MDLLFIFGGIVVLAFLIGYAVGRHRSDEYLRFVCRRADLLAAERDLLASQCSRLYDDVEAYQNECGPIPGTHGNRW